jgi:hypothetical protein
MKRYSGKWMVRNPAKAASIAGLRDEIPIAICASHTIPIIAAN